MVRAHGRRARLGALLAVACVFGSACAQLTKATGLSSPGGNPEAATAIVLSVPSDSIYLVDPTSGRAETVATGLTDLLAGHATWGPHHSTIAYGEGGIRLMDPSKLTSQLLVAAASVSMPALSPRGTSIVFGDGVHMWIISAKAPAPAPTTLQAITLPETLGPTNFDWVTAKRVVFEGTQLDCSNPEGCLATNQSDIWTIRSDGTELTQVTATADASDPKWAPAGRQILYVRSKAVKGFGSQLWAVKPDGTSPHQLVGAKNVVAGDWSGDGKHLVVIRADAKTSTLQVWVGNADGSNMHMVGDPIPGTDATVDW
jgi:hypothetical protein